MQPILTGLIGENITSSKSPKLHQTEAEYHGIPLLYELFDAALEPDPFLYLTETLKTTEKLGYSGINITHPFKQDVIAFVDELSSEAEFINAVNTVIFKDNKRIAFNTDYLGFYYAFVDEFNSVPIDKVIQIGAGGAGSAVAFAILKLGAKVLFIYDKQYNKALDLADRLQEKFKTKKIIPINDPAEKITQTNGLINTSPIGMEAYPGIAIPKELLRADLWVADIIYFPAETRLLAEANKLGCKSMNGGRMAVYQAALAFELFTGKQANKARMLESFNSSFK